jgi:hypothetical protein
VERLRVIEAFFVFGATHIDLLFQLDALKLVMETTTVAERIKCEFCPKGCEGVGMLGVCRIDISALGAMPPRSYKSLRTF